ncbi:hypothetical protein GCM10018780_42670 [Streptomyces lanatus]|nr:hypothetical protein GCM10018780_42670 [Streptomyces lanatus]
MVVDDQHSDANHETPFPRLSKSRGYPIVVRTTPGDEDRHGDDARNAKDARTAAAVQELLPPTSGVEPACLAP